MNAQQPVQGAHEAAARGRGATEPATERNGKAQATRESPKRQKPHRAGEARAAQRAAREEHTTPEGRSAKESLATRRYSEGMRTDPGAYLGSNAERQLAEPREQRHAELTRSKAKPLLKARGTTLRMPRPRFVRNARVNRTRSIPRSFQEDPGRSAIDQCADQPTDRPADRSSH